MEQALSLNFARNDLDSTKTCDEETA